jgi:hydrogenase maturation protease
MNEWEWHLLEDKAPVTSVMIAGVEVKPGDRVRLCPRDGGDVFDIALANRTATVESIEEDYEGQFHLAVVVDDDPGRDIGMMRQPGHRFFFSTTEVQPLMESKVEQPRSSTAAPSILVAGIGNIFLGDDAFGVEVARRLGAHGLPPGVRVTDFGIRGLDLAYALMDGSDFTILVDTCSRGGSPGDIYLIEAETDNLNRETVPTPAIDAHSMNPMNVIRMAQSMGGPLNKILILGCEPQTFGPEEGHMGLSEPVAEAVERAIPLIESVVNRIVNGESPLKLDTNRASVSQ